MLENETVPQGSEQNKTVGDQWGTDKNELCPHGRPINQDCYACEEPLPIDQDPSWWVNHWASGEDLHFGSGLGPDDGHIGHVKLSF